jgi:hypothetical protein
MEAILNMQTSRRALLAHAAPASAALVSIAAGAPTSATALNASPQAPDPVLALLAERARLFKECVAADERAVMIRRALPEAFNTPTAPVLDLDTPAARARAVRLASDPAFKRVLDLVDQDLAEEAAQRRERESAGRLRADAERERMDKLIADSGYKEAHEEFEALEAEGQAIEGVIAKMPATSLAGAFAKMKAGVEILTDAAGGDVDSLESHERLIVAGLAVLERLIAQGASAVAAA